MKTNNLIKIFLRKAITLLLLILMYQVQYAQSGLTNYGNGSGISGNYATYLGHYAGNECLPTSVANTLVGASSGRYIQGHNNAMFGKNTGFATVNGNNNTFIGTHAGKDNLDGSDNTYIGAFAGRSNINGEFNTFSGRAAGILSTGSNNVAIGYQAGYEAGEANVFIGNKAGFYETGSNRLYIDNTNTSEPLIHGQFDNDILTVNGYLGIGITAPQYKLDVCGTIRAEEVLVEDNWCDFVFEPEYCLTTLEEEADFIKMYGHLSNFESAEVMDGMINVNDIFKRQQIQIEENVLHLIEMNEENEVLQIQVDDLTDEVNQLNEKVSTLTVNYEALAKELAVIKKQLR